MKILSQKKIQNQFYLDIFVNKTRFCKNTNLILKKIYNMKKVLSFLIKKFDK